MSSSLPEKKHKVLLILPPICNFTGFSTSYTPPLGLMYVAAVLEKKNYRVKILDAEALSLSWPALKQKIKEEQPTVVGIGSTSLSLPALFKTIDLVKEVNPQARVVAGGPGPTFEPKKTLKGHRDIDAAVLQEGERTMVELMDCFDGRRQFRDIKGIAFREGDRIVTTPPREYIDDLDSLPFPAYHLLEPSLSGYQGMHGGFYEMKTPNTVIVGSRGCPHRCVFCSSGKIRNRWRSPKNIVDEVEFVHRVIGAQSIQFYDNEFIGMNVRQNRWVQEICDEIMKRKLDHLSYLTEGRCSQTIELAALQKMRAAGFKWIWWGVESGSQKVLDAIKKDVTLDDVRYSFRLAKQAGVKSLMFLMVGLPDETERDNILSGRLIEEVKPDRVRFHLTTPFPGSDLWNMLEEKNQIEDYNFLHYNTRGKAVHHTDTLSAKQMERLYQMLVFRYESSKSNFVKLLLKSFISPKEFRKLPSRIKRIFLYVPKWAEIKLIKRT